MLQKETNLRIGQPPRRRLAGWQRTLLLLTILFAVVVFGLIITQELAHSRTRLTLNRSTAGSAASAVP